MAVGSVSHGSSNVKRAVCLLTAQTANNSPPASATAGVPCYPDKNVYASETGAFFAVEDPYLSTLAISTSAGSGTMVGTFVLWGYLEATGVWYPMPVNPTAGVATALAETATDVIRFTQQFEGLGHFDRLYLELSGVGGTATAFEAWLVTPRKG